TLPVLLLALGCDDKEIPGTSHGEIVDSDTDADEPSEPANPTAGQPEGDDTGAPPADSEGEDEPAEPTEPAEPPPAPEPDKPSQPRPPAAGPCADLEWPYSQECTTESGEPGVSVCVVHEGEEVWTACGAEPECLPGDGYDQG